MKDEKDSAVWVVIINEGTHQILDSLNATSNFKLLVEEKGNLIERLEMIIADIREELS